MKDVTKFGKQPMFNPDGSINATGLWNQQRASRLKEEKKTRKIRRGRISIRRPSISMRTWYVMVLPSSKNVEGMLQDIINERLYEYELEDKRRGVSSSKKRYETPQRRAEQDANDSVIDITENSTDAFHILAQTKNAAVNIAKTLTHNRNPRIYAKEVHPSNFNKSYASIYKHAFKENKKYVHRVRLAPVNRDILYRFY